MNTRGADAFLVSGAGNDFLALIEPSTTPTPDEIGIWCRRGLSIGADGVFTLERRIGGGARMRYWNADGGAADLCLNGSRCAAQLGFHLGWANDRGRLSLETSAGVLEAARIDDHAVSLTFPSRIEAAAPGRYTVQIEDRDTHLDAWRIVVGVPHLVVPWPATLDQVPLDILGPQLRAHPDLDASGANVDFVRFADDGFDIRTFERGVEGETLACGTGVMATAAVGIAMGVLRVPAAAQTAGGFALRVDGTIAHGRLRQPVLGGDARILAALRLHAGALLAPPSVRWQR